MIQRSGVTVARLHTVKDNIREGIKSETSRHVESITYEGHEKIDNPKFQSEHVRTS